MQIRNRPLRHLLSTTLSTADTPKWPFVADLKNGKIRGFFANEAAKRHRLQRTKNLRPRHSSMEASP